jgi:hypothetical protein
MRTDRAEQIRSLPLRDFEANKISLMEELKTLRGVDPGWCNEAAGVLRTTEGRVYEVRNVFSSRRAVAWSYVVAIISSTLHLVVCLLCFGEVYLFRIILFNIPLTFHSPTTITFSSQCPILGRSLGM